MIKETDTHITGKLSIWLGTLFSLVSICLVIVNTLLPQTVELAVDVSLAFIIATFTLFATYVYGRLEHVAETQDRILSQPCQGVEVFHSADDLLRRLHEVTVGARDVSTLNLSPPRGATRPLDEYFHATHAYIRSSSTPLLSFRSLAHVSDYGRAIWVLTRTKELLTTGRFSQAVFDTTPTNVFSMGFHAVSRADGYYVFFYPGISLTGVMESFVIKSEPVYRIVLAYFDFMWAHSIVVHEGKNLRQEGLDRLKKVSAKIVDSDLLGELEPLAQQSVG